MGVEHWNAFTRASQPPTAGEGYDQVSKFMLSSLYLAASGSSNPKTVDLNGS